MNDGERQRDHGIDLEDAFQEFLLLADTPDATTLETMVAKYPNYASELTDFAVEWAMQDLLPAAAELAEPAADAALGIHSRAVTSAMERLHGALAATDDQPRQAWANPFQDRTAAELKGLAARLGLDKTLVAKLRDRRIEAETVPKMLCEQLAKVLEVPLRAVMAHLQGPPVLSMGASFKATGKPEAVGKETFARAVESSQLAAEDKKRLLSSESDRD